MTRPPDETIHADVAVVGSGFAGSILARALRAKGLSVALLERGRHPRFALGESSTPLANLSLERLAAAYGLPDLHHLATHGRWLRHLPHLTHGLKRGFSFFRHQPGEPLRADPDNPRRLLVAASPEDRVADTHWLRSDVDAHLVTRAVAEGVVYRDGVTMAPQTLENKDGENGCVVSGRTADGTEIVVRCGLVVDASGPGGFLGQGFGEAPGGKRVRSSPPATRGGAKLLIYGHFEGVDGLWTGSEGKRLRLSPGPYDDERAAVHHLLDEGWMYVLRLERRPAGAAEIVSAGLLLREAPPEGEVPEATWARVLERYPTLARQFGAARPLRLGRLDEPGRRASAVVGDGWLRLPHAYCFVDPLFSTGMAWSLAGVERVVEMVGPGGGVDAASRTRYADLLEREADAVEDLIAAAYVAMPCFEAFTALSQLYFVAVSWAETLRRLCPEPEDAWRGFLGVGDEVLDGLPGRVRARIEELAAEGWPASGVTRFESWLKARLLSRNIAGFFEPKRRNLYPADLDVMAQRAELLALEPADVRERMLRLLEAE